MCGQDCEGFDCWSPEAIHARAQNAAVDSARDAADEALHAKLERVVGALAVDRVMLGVAIFHAIMAVCLCGVESSKDPRARLQNGAWGLKLLLYVGLIAGMFWVDTDMFDDVTALFRVGAFCFVLVQLTMLIESAYVTDGYLGEKRETHGPGWLYLSLLCVLAMYGFTVFVFAVTIAKNQSAPDGCSEGVWAVMINFFLMIATTGLSIVRIALLPSHSLVHSLSPLQYADSCCRSMQSEFVRGATNGEGSKNGVFQSSMVAAYASYQVLSALINHPDERCHLMDIQDGSTKVKLLGLLFTFVAVLWSAVRNGSHTEGSAPLVQHDTASYETEARGSMAPKDDEHEGVQYSYSQFHAVFSLAAMYIAMLLTRWGAIEGVDHTLQVRDSETSVWVKIISSWLCFVMYATVMVLPPMCPERQFAGAERVPFEAMM
jgi:hypothetical protein